MDTSLRTMSAKLSPNGKNNQAVHNFSLFSKKKQRKKKK